MTEVKHTANAFRIRGFTIIELAIVMFVSTMLVVTFISVATSRFSDVRRETTNARMKTIWEQITRYANVHGRLPCPADIALSVTHVDFGKGLYLDAQNQDLGCIKTGPIPSTGTAMAGAVPVRDLGISTGHATDGWDRKFLYVIERRYAEKDYFSDGCEQGKCTNTQSSIIITNAGGRQIAPDISLPIPTSYPVAVLITYGPNGLGAYKNIATDGELRLPMPTEPKKVINAAITNVYSQYTPDMSPNTTEGDDWVDYRNRYQIVPPVTKVRSSSSSGSSSGEP